MQTCIEEKDYELAVDHIQKFYKEFLCLQDDVEDVYIELIESVEEKLKRTIQSKLDQALKENNLNEIGRFSALHSGLGMKDVGLGIYLKQYIEELIKNEGNRVIALLEVHIQQLAKQNKMQETKQLEFVAQEWKGDEEDEGVEEEEEEEKQLDFVDSVKTLYEYVAYIINYKQKFIENYFGLDGMHQVVAVLQSHCDKYSSDILETFLNHYKIQDLVRRDTILTHDLPGGAN